MVLGTSRSAHGTEPGMGSPELCRELALRSRAAEVQLKALPFIYPSEPSRRIVAAATEQDNMYKST